MNKIKDFLRNNICSPIMLLIIALLSIAFVSDWFVAFSVLGKFALFALAGNGVLWSVLRIIDKVWYENYEIDFFRMCKGEVEQSDTILTALAIYRGFMVLAYAVVTGFSIFAASTVS